MSLKVIQSLPQIFVRRDVDGDLEYMEHVAKAAQLRYPRLTLIYIQSAAVRLKSPVIPLGNSARAWLQAIGIRNDDWRTCAGVKYQSRCLVSCRVAIGESVGGRDSTSEGKIVERFDLWRDTKQDELFENTAHLSQSFYESLVNHAVPHDPRAIAALRSSLEIDLYMFLAHRLPRVKGVKANVSWARLKEQFGQEYKDAKNFKHAVPRRNGIALPMYP